MQSLSLPRLKIRVPRLQPARNGERTLREFTVVRAPNRFPFIGLRIRTVTNVRSPIANNRQFRAM